MRRWLTHLFIACYLSSLSLGIVSQTLKFGTSSHPAMYFFIWDMFCGWSAYESRYHIIGEGDSGTCYWLTPCPWGDFQPYGDLSRSHYDYYGNGLVRMAQNTLRHTEHEPIRRFYSVEESWPKKYNLPDHLWALRFSEPKDPVSYYYIRGIYDSNGTVIERRPDFLAQLYADAIYNNPRLQADSARGRPMFAVSPYERRVIARENGTLEDARPVWNDGRINAN